jgi:hypothetical protein
MSFAIYIAFPFSRLKSGVIMMPLLFSGTIPNPVGATPTRQAVALPRESCFGVDVICRIISPVSIRNMRQILLHEG